MKPFFIYLHLFTVCQVTAWMAENIGNYTGVHKPTVYSIEIRTEYLNDKQGNEY